MAEANKRLCHKSPNLSTPTATNLTGCQREERSVCMAGMPKAMKEKDEIKMINKHFFMKADRPFIKND